jgi:hypothetical protein
MPALNQTLSNNAKSIISEQDSQKCSRRSRLITSFSLAIPPPRLLQAPSADARRITTIFQIRMLQNTRNTFLKAGFG